jgi:hypothetical protein
MDYKEILHERVVVFTFKKKDGSERVMRGTTNLDLIPASKHPKSVTEGAEGTRKVNDSVIAVFDLDADEWRSFIIDNLVEFDGVKT